MSGSLSLVVPSGHFILGNLLGAVVRWTIDQRQVGGLYGVADLYALTLEHDPAQVRALTAEQVGVLLAAGLDPERCTIFVQSQVPAHTELLWLLESTVRVGELQRMVQFKQKAAGRDAVRASLLTYPVLMAADILLYGTEEVPVGDDQRQHLELARVIAQRFNTSYGETFVMPRATTPSASPASPTCWRSSAPAPARLPTPSPGNSPPTGNSRTPSLTRSWNCSRPCSTATPRSRPILDTSRACCTTARPLPARLPHRPWRGRKRRLGCYQPRKAGSQHCLPAIPPTDRADQGATNAGREVGGDPVPPPVSSR